MRYSFIIFVLLSLLPPVARLGAQGGSFLLDTGGATAFDVDLAGRVVLVRGAQNTLALAESGIVVRTIGGGGWSENEFDGPAAVWAKNGLDIYVADYGNHRIQRFDRNLNFVSSLETRTADDPAVRFGYPTDVALSRQGDLYVCDSENARVVKGTDGNRPDRSIGGIGGGKGRLLQPRRIAIGPRDRLYVTDRGRVAVFDSFGNYLYDLAAPPLIPTTGVDADEMGTVVLSGSLVYVYDASDRFTGRVSLDSLGLPASLPVRDVALAGGSLVLLTDSAVTSIGDPRPRADGLQK